MAASFIPSDFPPINNTNVSVLEMNDTHSPFIYDAVNSKKADPPGIRNGEFVVQHANTAIKLSAKRDAMKISCPDSDFSVTHFENWGTTVSSLLLLVKPTTRDEVNSIIEGAIANDIKVGMGGAYHSWSPTYPDSGGMIINTCDLLLPPSPAGDTWTSARMRLNSEALEVTIAPGVTTGQLTKFFLENGVCFKADVILPSVTYGGVFSGGCHGVGKDTPSMSDWITHMTVVTGDGRTKVIPDDFASSGFSDEEILSAASVSLGMFGVILDVTVKVTPMANSRVKNVFSHKLSLLNGDPANFADLTALIQETESLEMFWFPFNSIFDHFTSKSSDGKVQLKANEFSGKEIAEGRVNRLASIDKWSWDPWKDDLWSREINPTTDEVTQDPGVPIWSMILDVITGGAGVLAKTILGSVFTRITPLSLALGFKLLKLQYGDKQADEVVKIPWAVHYRDAIDMTYAYDMEFAFPIDINYPTILTQAVGVVINLTDNYSKKGFFPDNDEVHSYPLNLAMEFRIMKKSTALLCPASLGDQSHVLYIEVLSTTNTPGTEAYFKEIAAAWQLLGGIPHWQKQWTFLDKNGSMVTYLKDKYGENLTQFKKVRDTLQLDPNNMFVNSVYTHILNIV